MKIIKIKTTFITLQQFLKFSGIVSSGSEAKELILSNTIKVDNIQETRRGRKLYPNQTVEFNNIKYLIKKGE